MNITHKPNLYIVGFQRCGSTYLFNKLVTHPDIIGTTPKETFFLTDKAYDSFDPQHNITQGEKGWEAYVNQETTSQKFILEASVCNFYQENAIDYLKANKESKVIFILRDPIERFISTYMYFGHWINREIGELTIDEFYRKVKEGVFKRHTLKYALEHGKYVQFLNQWEAALGSENIMLLGMKEVIKSENEVFERLSSFLGIDNQYFEEISQANQANQPKNKKLHKMLLSKIGGKKFVGKQMLRKWYNTIFLKKHDKVSLSNDILEELKTYYKEEYETLGKYF